MTTKDIIPEPPTAPIPERHHHHCEHDEIQKKAYELWEEMISSHGVDYGSEYYWYLAEFQLGVGPNPLPPPVE